MSSDLYFEGKKYISSKRAAEVYGYTRDYIGQLIRGKKVDAKMIGRSWFVSAESLNEYQLSFSANPKVTNLWNSSARGSRDGQAVPSVKKLSVTSNLEQEAEKETVHPKIETVEPAELPKKIKRRLKNLLLK